MSWFEILSRNFPGRSQNPHEDGIVEIASEIRMGSLRNTSEEQYYFSHFLGPRHLSNSKGRHSLNPEFIFNAYKNYAFGCGEFKQNSSLILHYLNLVTKMSLFWVKSCKELELSQNGKSEKKPNQAKN